MLIHATLHAAEPERVARFLALLWGTEAMPVPEIEGAWIAFASGEGIASVVVEPASLPRPAMQLAIATRLSETAVHALAATEGWLSRHAMRFGEAGVGCGHAVVSVAIEPSLAIEVLPEAMAAVRAEVMRPWRWGARLAGMLPPAPAMRKGASLVPPMPSPFPCAEAAPVAGHAPLRFARAA